MEERDERTEEERNKEHIITVARFSSIQKLKVLQKKKKKYLKGDATKTN